MVAGLPGKAWVTASRASRGPRVGVGGGDGVGAGLDFDGVGAAGGADEAFLIDQPVVFSIEWLTARQRTRWSGGLRWSRAGGGRSVGLVRRALDIRNKNSRCGTPGGRRRSRTARSRGSVGAGGQVGDVSLQASHGAGPGLQCLFTVRVPPESWTSDEPAAQHDRSVQSPWS